MRKFYDKCTIKRDLQKVVRQLPQKLRQNVRQLISCRTTASRTHAVIILIFYLSFFLT